MSSAPAPWSASDEQSFAYESTVDRWPKILNGVISDLQTLQSVSQDEVDSLIAQIRQLIDDIMSYKELADLPRDGEPNLDVYQSELDRLRSAGQSNWKTGPWLYCECYLYRLLRSWFSQTTTLKQHDPFAQQKRSTFKSSNDAVLELVKLIQSFHDSESTALVDLQKTFLELAQINLWGNATDLSLLTSLTHADIVQLQSGDAAAKAGNILANDLAACWTHLSSLQGGRLDFVFDNSGFEVFTDFLLADWLVSKTPFVDTIVFHPKTIPWFVSDVINSLDVDDMFLHLESLVDTLPAVHTVVARWKQHFTTGAFQITTPPGAKIGQDVPLANFWTGPLGFRDLPSDDPHLFKELQKSDLVIFKGDLNYRKLTGDLRWSPDTPFTTAIGNLNGTINLLSLRTCKADVVVGLTPGKAEELDAKDKRWRVNGKYAVISFAKAQS